MKIKSFFVMAMLFVSVLALAGIANALTISEVKLDNDELRAGDNFIEKDDEYEVKVIFNSVVNETYDDVQVRAYLSGDSHDDEVEDVSDTFDIEDDTQYVKKLTLNLPERMDQDSYLLFVRIEDRHGLIQEELSFNLLVRAEEHQVTIRDVILSPSNGVQAGRALLATVRIQNRGQNEEEDVKVTFSIPSLSVSASDYIDELDEEGEDKDSKSTEELYLRIPQCAEEGSYTAEIEVEFDDGDEFTTETVLVDVIADETCVLGDMDSGSTGSSGKTTVSAGPETQDVTMGAGGVVYPVTITNSGNSKTYTVSVTGGDWGDFRVTPSNVVTVGQDETKTVFIYASANDNAASGNQLFGVTVSADGMSEDFTLNANVVKGDAGFGGFKRVLEVGLIVLVVILVILGLVIGFNKLKGDEEDNEEGDSYY